MIDYTSYATIVIATFDDRPTIPSMLVGIILAGRAAVIASVHIPYFRVVQATRVGEANGIAASVQIWMVSFYGIAAQ
jgi:hypothetical protein